MDKINMIDYQQYSGDKNLRKRKEIILRNWLTSFILIVIFLLFF